MPRSPARRRRPPLGYIASAPHRVIVATRSSTARAVPGLAVVGTLATVAFALGGVLPAVSPLIWAMLLGALTASIVRRAPATRAGITLSARRLLRIGVALLGLRVSLGEISALGVSGLTLAAGTVTITLIATVGMGGLLGVERKLTLLIAAGSSICGAAAIAAMDAATRADEEDVGYAVATVTIFGTLAMLLIPVVGLHIVDLGPRRTGLWAGASIHEVAQVAGAGGGISAIALKAATLVKLARVVLLAPAVAAVNAAMRDGHKRSKLTVPAFVMAFLALVVVRSAVDVPSDVLAIAEVVSTLLLAAALAGLGLQINIHALRRAGLRPLALGFAASLVAAVTGLSLVAILQP
jgi:uncharacterized integral membrane protein (TIGR00698 family)